MIRFPTSSAQAMAAPGTWRAGGTDLTELRQRGLHTGDLVDLRDVTDLSEIRALDEGGWYLGARVTLRQVAEHGPLGESCPGLTQAFGGLATPQIRARATVGGSLMQQVRCWYYRDAEVHCLKKGGGAVGVGEVGGVAVPAALANAVFHATGRRPQRLPLSPERVTELLA